MSTEKKQAAPGVVGWSGTKDAFEDALRRAYNAGFSVRVAYGYDGHKAKLNRAFELAVLQGLLGQFYDYDLIIKGADE